MEIPQGDTLENSGKQNPEMGFKPTEHIVPLQAFLSGINSSTYDISLFT
jgi:hypothetical protein